MLQKIQKNKNYVKGVFDKVFNKYDLMNDLMSLGAHRYWKKELIHMLNPSKSKKLIDVGCGTGDIPKIYLEMTKSCSEILCVDPNQKMLNLAKKKLSAYKNIKYKLSYAEKLKAPDKSFNYYIISFGLRNTGDINKNISEAYRVLKVGGKFLCLEFSKIENDNLDKFYKFYSKLIPKIGKVVVGEDEPYKYLIKSIDKFVNQEQLKNILIKNQFKNCGYRNLSGGIVSIHYGWKL